jgi:hypothetical protein
LQEGKRSDNVTGKMRHINDLFPSVKGHRTHWNTTTRGILQNLLVTQSPRVANFAQLKVHSHLVLATLVLSPLTSC